MNEYEFILKFAVPVGLDAQTLEDRLFEAGCDDALVGTGQKGRLALSFARKATSAHRAVTSAIRDVQKAVPGARLVEVGPDLVGVSDIAELFSFSRQNMRKLVLTHIESFPLPLHEGRQSIWHLLDVLNWFSAEQEKQVEPALFEVARVSMKLNVRREANRLAGKPG